MATRKRAARKGSAARAGGRRGPEQINPALGPLVVKLDTLRADPDNAREHGEASIEALRRSLRRFGQQKPVVCLVDGTVVAGNGLAEAARSLGWTRLAAVVLPARSRAEARAYALADNRTAELSVWNPARLAETLAALEAVEIPAVDLGFLDDLVPAAPATPEPVVMTADEEQPEREERGGDGPPVMGAPLSLTLEQRRVFARAREKVLLLGGWEGEGNSISDGRALEMICAEFLA